MVVVEIKGEIQVSTTCVVLMPIFSPKPPGFGISPTRSRPSWRSMSRDGAGRVRTRAVHRSSVVPRLLAIGYRLSAIGYRLSAIGCRLGRRRRRVPPGGTSDPAPGTRHDEVWTDDESILLRAVRSFVRSFRVLTPGFSPPVSFSRLLFFLSSRPRHHHAFARHHAILRARSQSLSIDHAVNSSHAAPTTRVVCIRRRLFEAHRHPSLL